MPVTSRPATILEVARDAGVSKTSVSRYYSGERERLSASMQQRIVQAAERLGYQPNPMARGLKGGPSGLVGMLVADIRNPFSVAVMHGVEQACRRQGLSLMVCNTDNDPTLERRNLSLLTSYRIEGLIVNAAGRHGDALAELAGDGLPLVLLDRSLEGIDADEVGLDNDRAIDMALDHLTERGYRRVLFVTEPPARASSRQARMARFEANHASHGLEGEVLSLELDDTTGLDHGVSAFLDTSDGHPAAILCGNGQVTLAVTRALQARRVPLGDIGLMGIDELDWCQLVTPGITTLAQPTDAIGQAAVDRLRARQAERATPEPRHERFTPTLMPRASTCRSGTEGLDTTSDETRP
ncbi:LacI family DNA-binding transcriptional regulator [Halomonas sp. I1]|uniref:LacI family DNA-binding transcriptional regulator n=1 Tax=Halomonas sp. I1 TaxID=393536 RepID=UPI0028DDF1D4|nr:LacI family DNA-binding transcriptional regulator [Halomonas sp. I1]MDT8893059.1 LacI family DNA-binding transcriptional regulator [Halomonas sp. I1]